MNELGSKRFAKFIGHDIYTINFIKYADHVVMNAIFRSDITHYVFMDYSKQIEFTTSDNCKVWISGDKIYDIINMSKEPFSIDHDFNIVFDIIVKDCVDFTSNSGMTYAENVTSHTKIVIPLIANKFVSKVIIPQTVSYMTTPLTQMAYLFKNRVIQYSIVTGCLLYATIFTKIIPNTMKRMIAFYE